MKSGQNGLGFQNFYNIPQGVEVPLLTYQWFSNLIQCHRYGNCGTELVADDRYNLGKTHRRRLRNNQLCRQDGFHAEVASNDGERGRQYVRGSRSTGRVCAEGYFK